VSDRIKVDRAGAARWPANRIDLVLPQGGLT